MAAPKTFASLIANFADFLTVAIHTIIYERNIYSTTAFISSKKYNFPVRQCRHPKVCSWIQDAVSAVQEDLLKGTIDRVAVVIYSPSSHPLERFVFDLSKFPVVPKTDHYTEIQRDMATQSDPSVNLQEQFRALLARLTGCHNKLTPLPRDCSFTVAIELKDTADAPIGHPQPWIPAQPSLQKVSSSSDSEAFEDRLGADLGGVKTSPVRSIDAGEMVFEMWIEEGNDKEDAVQRETSASTQLSD